MKYTTLCLKDLMVFIIWKACLMNQRVLGKSKVVKNTISKSNKLISLLLLLIVFLTTFDLPNTLWFIRQAFQMMKTIRSFKQSVVYFIVIYFWRYKTI